jgi:VIT1/CCC1 family predicted Fe2+/Mn2+ transporter
MSERLQAAVRRVLSAEEVVERQRNRVEELNAAGKSAVTSKALLEIYISTLAIFEDYALTVRAEVEQRNGRHFELVERKAVAAGAPAHPRR